VIPKHEEVNNLLVSKVMVLYTWSTVGMLTASALSFMLQSLGKTVVVTGSQIPCFETRNDGRDNLDARWSELPNCMINAVVEVGDSAKGNVELKVYNPSLSKKKGATIEMRKVSDFEYCHVEQLRNIIIQILSEKRYIWLEIFQL
jgi:hypothetical protein